MGRRINVSRRYPKIRGIKRRLKALDCWANSFVGYFPVEHAGEQYWNYKIPVLDILVSPPKTTRKIQAHCANSLITAANHLLEARPPELADAKVTALITYPDMFSSELCIFFDSNYFNSFFDRHDEYQSLTLLNKELSLITKLDLKLPQAFQAIGFEFRNNGNGLDELTDYIEQWWSIREK